MSKTPDPPKDLPDGWSAHLDSDTNLYYFFHAATGQSQWNKPQPPSAIARPPPRPNEGSTSVAGGIARVGSGIAQGVDTVKATVQGVQQAAKTAAEVSAQVAEANRKVQQTTQRISEVFNSARSLRLVLPDSVCPRERRWRARMRTSCSHRSQARSCLPLRAVRCPGLT